MTGADHIGDRTNFVQGLMHMVKGNLGTGILAMPSSFSHAGLIPSLIGLPFLCVVATYCVHIIIRSTSQLQIRRPDFKDSINFASLAETSFQAGPSWMRYSSRFMGKLVDGTLLVAQVGVCCVYLVFVRDNISWILSSYNIKVNQNIVYIFLFPFVLILSFIRTLKRLAIASACANMLQAIGIVFILEYLMRDMSKLDLAKRDKVKPFEDIALGFGSAMFAFEGISVVLPVYLRMRDQSQMSGFLGLINVSYGILLVLYFSIGLFGFLRYGKDTQDIITLNLPKEPLYDVVRFMFAISVLLTYPLQFYVPNEILWNWVKNNFLINHDRQIHATMVLDIDALNSQNSIDPNPSPKQNDKMKINDLGKFSQKSVIPNNDTIAKNLEQKLVFAKFDSPLNVIKFESSEAISVAASETHGCSIDAQDYLCRTIIVALTFMVAICVPKLNLLMGFIGSFTGSSLSLIIPGLIHIGTFWHETSGCNRTTMVLLDVAVISFGVLAGLAGSISSLSEIISSFS